MSATQAADDRARLRHEARAHRAQARRLRAAARAERDLVQALRLRISAGDRTALARAADREARA